jgi:GDP-4-dehydro-6-deoxy-D-mannose reductase
LRIVNHNVALSHGKITQATQRLIIAEIEKGSGPVIHVGNLEARRDFTDVRDVVRGYSLAVEKCQPGEPYNICSGKTVKIKDVLGRDWQGPTVQID